MTLASKPNTDTVLERGSRRFNIYERGYRAYAGKPLKGAKLLDFGCGAGGVMFAAEAAGVDVTGVEVDSDRRTQFLARKPARPDSFILYDGGILPLPSESFDAVHSWFVFEHVTDPGLSLREIARVVKPGGYVEIFAEDARNAWDGHIQRPWPPFMPRKFTRAYLSAFDLEHRTEFVEKYVVSITAPIVANILLTCGFEILTCLPEQPDRKVDGMLIHSDAEARQAGMLNRAAFEAGLITPPTQNMHVLARKRA